MNSAEKAKIDFKLWAAVTDVKDIMDKLSALPDEELELFNEGLLDLEEQLQRISISEDDDGQ